MCGIKVHCFFIYAKIRFKIKSKNRVIEGLYDGVTTSELDNLAVLGYHARNISWLLLISF